MSNNPLKFAVPTPVSPGSSLIGTQYPLRVEVGIDAPDVGALQTSLLENGSGNTIDLQCINLEDNLNQARTFNLSWTENAPGSFEYTIKTQYRPQGGCPIDDSHEGDLTQTYLVNWEEDVPELEIYDGNGLQKPTGSMVDVGQQEYYQEVVLDFSIYNNSTTSSMQVNGIRVENLINLSDAVVNPSGAIILAPGETRDLSVSFLVSEFGDFSFDLAAAHDAGNTNPYRITITGSGEMTQDPFYSLVMDPTSPGSSMVMEMHDLQVQAEINPPAPGVIEIALLNQTTREIIGDTCLPVLGDHSLLNVDLSWAESAPGDVMYDIQARYQANGACPLEGDVHAELSESYQVSWLVDDPVLVVNRPEGVTIFDGAVDYVGEHEFFRFVEVTYVIENDADAAPLIIDDIEPQNLTNLREVLFEPALPIIVGPGEAVEVKINFQILMLEPFSFDLVWDHTGANASPYQMSIEGTSILNLGEGVPEQSWLHGFIESLIQSGFFLKLPPLWLAE
jgi:hypothetical protein